MKKLVLVGLIVASTCFGQRSDTIYQTVFTQQKALATFIVRNIGQPFHLIQANLIEGPGACGVAGTWVGRLELQASFDGSTYFTIGQPLTVMVSSPATTVPSFTSGYGAYPYVRVSLTASNDTTDCAFTVYYSGSLYGATLTDVYQNNMRTGRINVGGAAVGVGAPLTVAVGNGCGITTQSQILSVYGMYLANKGTAAATNIFVQVVDSAGSPLIVDGIQIGTLNPNEKVIFPNSAAPWLGGNQFIGGYTLPLKVILLTNGEVNSNVIAQVQQRCE